MLYRDFWTSGSVVVIQGHASWTPLSALFQQFQRHLAAMATTSRTKALGIWCSCSKSSNYVNSSNQYLASIQNVWFAISKSQLPFLRNFVKLKEPFPMPQISQTCQGLSRTKAAKLGRLDCSTMDNVCCQRPKELTILLRSGKEVDHLFPQLWKFGSPRPPCGDNFLGCFFWIGVGKMMIEIKSNSIQFCAKHPEAHISSYLPRMKLKFKFFHAMHALCLHIFCNPQGVSRQWWHHFQPLKTTSGSRFTSFHHRGWAHMGTCLFRVVAKTWDLGQVESSQTATIGPFHTRKNPFSIGSLVVPSVNLSNNEGPQLIGF